MSNRPRSVLDGFLRTVRRQPDDVAIRDLEGFDVPRPQRLTWTEYRAQVAQVAGGLASMGVEPGDRVVLMMPNRVEFHIADLAVVALGATPISIYNSSSPEQIAYLVGHSKASAAIVADGSYVERILAAAGECPGLRLVVVVGDAPQGTVGWAELLNAAPIDLDSREY